MRKLTLVLGLGALAFGGCATSSQMNSPSAKAERGLASTLVSDDQENQIGDQVYAELQQKGTKFITDPTVVNYVQSISDRLLTYAKKDRPGVNWRIYVIDDPKTVNAFSTPGGRLYVYSGLINAADSDAQIAGVMGHEIGHEVLHHVAQGLIASNGLQAVADLALGKNPSLAGKLATAIVGNGTLLAYSRGDETQADEYGATVESKAGFNPQGIVEFFRKLQGQEGKMPGIAKYLSDHPLTADRITHLQQYIAQNHLTGSMPESGQIAQVKARLNSGAVASTPMAPGSSASGAQGGTPTHGGTTQPTQQQPAQQPTPGQVPVHH